MRIPTLLISLLCVLTLTADAQSSWESLEYRSVGPARGGRVTAVAGVAAEPGTFYLGATGGGVWKTTDYGTVWKNISDGYFSTPSIGAIKVAQNDPNILYVGTGSDGLRSNVITGKGVYKSIDAGGTWEHIGLDAVGQIGGLIIHPQNHNVVYVAAIGQAFEPNEDRGVYKTTDGGRTWEKILYLSDHIGFSDIEFLPGNPDILFATAWKAERKPWTIISGGSQEEGGIYKSVDGGENWEKVTEGLPSELIGKIDVAVCPSDTRIVYALVEAPDDQGGLYRSTDQGASFQQVSSHRGIRTRPFYYTNIRVDPTNANVIYALATGYYKSVDGGNSWSRMRPPHGDNHDMWINPDNPNLFVQANDGGANVTHNGGKTWSTQFNQPTAELYQVEVDDQYPYWLYAGQQDNYTTIAVPSLAPSAIQADGIGWIINTGGCETGPAVPKPGNHNIVYSNCKGRFGVFDKRTGIERSYYVGASNMYGHNPRDLRYRFQRVSPIHVSPHNPDVVYHCSQFVHRTTDDGQSWETISPDLTAFEADKQVISGSPITRDITGEEFYSTIYSLRESPVQAGVIWSGANDGPVYVTRDNGVSWQNVTPSNLPPGGRVDAVEPSPHDPAKAYIAVLRYQLGDWQPHIYRTNDYGQSWQRLSNGRNGIPIDYPTRVVREDPVREGLLFAGTEFGLFVSFDDGANWQAFQQNLPITPITDIKIHRGDLVLSTMGRGFYVLDNISPLRHEVATNLDDAVVLFPPPTTIRYRAPMVRSGGFPNYPTPGVFIDYYLPKDMEGGIHIEVLNDQQQVIRSFSSEESSDETMVIEDMGLNQYLVETEHALDGSPGLHRFEWDMQLPGPWHANQDRRYRNGPLAPPGMYSIRLTAGATNLTEEVELLMDPRVEATGTTAEDVAEQAAIQRQVVALLSEARRLEADWTEELEQLEAKDTLTEKEATRKETLAEAVTLLQTEEGVIYPQPRLSAQISYLYFMLTGADQAPGHDAATRLTELSTQLEELKQSVD